jgi:hypothetical protein
MEIRRNKLICDTSAIPKLINLCLHELEIILRMNFSTYRNLMLQFIAPNLGEIVELFLDASKQHGPGAAVIEQTITNGQTKNEIHWERASEIRCLYGEPYIDVISYYTPASPVIYIIIAQTQEYGYRAEVTGVLYQIDKNTLAVSPLGLPECHFSRTEKRLDPMLAQLTRLLGAEHQ